MQHPSFWGRSVRSSIAGAALALLAIAPPLLVPTAHRAVVNPAAAARAFVAQPTTTTTPSTTTTSTTSTTSPSTTSPPATHHVSPVATSTTLYAAWSKVAVCEEGGWIGRASTFYPDSLGINSTNWTQFGGGSDVSPAAQIAVAMRLIAYYHASIPDQHGCQKGGW